MKRVLGIDVHHMTYWTVLVVTHENWEVTRHYFPKADAVPPKLLVECIAAIRGMYRKETAPVTQAALPPYPNW